MREFKITPHSSKSETAHSGRGKPLIVLLEDWGWRDVEVEAGMHSDGASIPWFGWYIVGSPFQPDVIRAAMLHDLLYIRGGTSEDRKFADNLFYDRLVHDGVSRWRARIMWAVLRLAGWWYW